MEDKLKSFRQSDDNIDIINLKRYVNSLDMSTISSDVTRICIKDNGPYLLQTLFLGLTENEKRIKVIEKILSVITQNLVSSKIAGKLLDVLKLELESFSVAQKLKLANLCLETIQKATESEDFPFWKELLPKLLVLISEYEEIEHNGSAMSGLDYKNEVITSICMSQLPHNVITNVATMMKEIPLSKEEHLKVVHKLCSYIDKLDPDEIPPLTHHLLQLTKTQNSVVLFVTLQQYFATRLYKTTDNQSQDQVTMKKLRSVESTILYHIESSASFSGPESIKELIKIFKENTNSPEFLLDPFFVILLLTVSNVSYNFKEEVMTVLKATVTRSIKEAIKMEESAWLETIVHSNLKVDDVFNLVIEKGLKDRDGVLKGLIEFGFTLLNTSRSRGNEIFAEKMWKIGTEIIIQVVKKCSYVTQSVLRTLYNQISQASESPQYCECLRQLAAKSPLNVSQSYSILIQLLDNVCAKQPGSTGYQVLSAVIPLSKMSPALRDNLIMVLRKALFPVDPLSRQLGVSGFLLFLQDLRISNLITLSQSITQKYSGFTEILSQTYNSSSHSNEGLCLEVLSILREVFKQQYEIRVAFYRGVYNAVCFNPALGTHVLVNLQPQLDKFYIPGDEVICLDFEKTLKLKGAEVVVEEPLALLIITIGLIFARTEEEEDSDECSLTKLRKQLGDICKRLSRAEVNDFNLEPEDGSNILDTTPEALIKQEVLSQALSTYEALLGYTICSWSQSTPENATTFLALFKAYSKLSDYAKGLNKTEKGKKKDEEKKEKAKVPFKFPPPVLNLKYCCRMLSLLHNETVTWASSDTVVEIKSKREIHRYAIQATLTWLKDAQAMQEFELKRIHSILNYISHLGKTLYKQCICRMAECKEFDIPTTTACLESFQELIILLTTRFKTKVSNILGDICDVPVERGIRLQLKCIIDTLLDQLEERLKDQDDEDDDPLVKKMTVALVSNVFELVQHLPRGGTSLQEILDKVRKMCKEYKIENPNVAKPMFTLLLTLYIKQKPHGRLMLEIVLCLCKCMDLVDDEIQFEDHISYNSINERTANVCIVALCDALKYLINEVEWAIARLRATLLSLTFPTDQSLEERRTNIQDKEHSLCQHINFIAKVLSHLCKLAVAPGVYSDAVIKELSNFFEKLSKMTKYFIVKWTKYKQSFQTARFDRTVKLVDHDLTKYMYKFIDHVISDGTGNVSNKNSSINPSVLRTRVMKETKSIPKLILAKEEFQKQILFLSNKSKIDLVSQIKHAQARDYRLHTKQVKDALEKENMQVDEEEDLNDETTSEDTGRTQKKRQRVEDS